MGVKVECLIKFRLKHKLTYVLFWDRSLQQRFPLPIGDGWNELTYTDDDLPNKYNTLLKEHHVAH